MANPNVSLKEDQTTRARAGQLRLNWWICGLVSPLLIYAFIVVFLSAEWKSFDHRGLSRGARWLMLAATYCKSWLTSVTIHEPGGMKAAHFQSVQRRLKQPYYWTETAKLNSFWYLWSWDTGPDTPFPFADPNYGWRSNGGWKRWVGEEKRKTRQEKSWTALWKQFHFPANRGPHRAENDWLLCAALQKIKTNHCWLLNNADQLNISIVTLHEYVFKFGHSYFKWNVWHHRWLFSSVESLRVLLFWS